MYHTIVIGLGAMGSATAYHLSRRGHAVLGLEQYPLGHALGSSHGQTRIIRKAYFEHPDYVPLLEKAYALWHALDESAGEELINTCGLVLAGLDDDTVIAGTRRAAAAHGLPLEVIAPAAAARRFPGIRFDPDMTVLFDPVGGYLRVEKCVRAHLDGARNFGARLKSEEQVLGWSATPDAVEVTTNRGTYNARHLAICAGPWAGALMRDLALPLKTHRVVTAWFQPADPRRAVERETPVFAMQTPRGFFYGFPQLDDRGVKIAEHAAGSPVSDPAAIDRKITPEDVRSIQEFARDYAPHLHPEVHSANACIYTMTPDSHFILDRHPAFENVYLAAGFSGHGFKFSAAIGSIMADLCEGGTTREPVAFLGLRRFLAG